MRILLNVLAPVLFAATASYYAGSELYRRKHALSEDEGGDDNARQTVVWKGRSFDRRGVWRAAGLVLLPGTGLYLLGALCYHNPPLYNLKLLFCYTLAVVAACIDGACRIIPNPLVLAGMLGGVCFQLTECILGYITLKASVLEAVLGVLMGGGVFLLCAMIMRGGIGMGDVKLFAALGLALGWTGVFDLIFLSVLMMALYGVILMIRKRLTIHTQVPVGPFALAGMTLMMLLGV